MNRRTNLEDWIAAGRDAGAVIAFIAIIAFLLLLGNFAIEALAGF